MILQRTPGRLKSFILIIHDVEDCDPKRHDAEKQNAEKHRALRLESNQHSQEKNDDGRNERATREGRGAQRGTVRRRVEPREVFCSVSKSFAFECYVTSTSAYLLQQKKLNNRTEYFQSRKSVLLMQRLFTLSLHLLFNIKTSPRSFQKIREHQHKIYFWPC